ncbi:spc97 / Spc98 family of spindle pole body (SBP) component isoform X2 [Wolffia australiana]
MNLTRSDSESTATLLGLTHSLSSVFSGGESLLQVVNGAVPREFFNAEVSIPPADLSVHILDYLYERLNEVSPILGGEEEAYHMLTFLFIGSCLPYLKGLNSWLFDGVLDDPYEEMFFYENSSVTIDQAAFWSQSYLLRSWTIKTLHDITMSFSDGNPAILVKEAKQHRKVVSQGKNNCNIEDMACPVFLKDIAWGIISAGKSLKLVQFLNEESHSDFCRKRKPQKLESRIYRENMSYLQDVGSLTLSEIFLVSFVGLVSDGSHILDDITRVCHSFSELHAGSEITLKQLCGELPVKPDSENLWLKFFIDTIRKKNMKLNLVDLNCDGSTENLDAVKEPSFQSFYPENPAITVCHELDGQTSDFREALNISRSFQLPPLLDEILRLAIFGEDTESSVSCQKGTDYAFGFRHNEYVYRRYMADVRSLRSLFPFPTILPGGTDDLPIPEILPFQEDSALASRVLNWFQNAELKAKPLPAVIILNCMQIFIGKQVDHVGKQILLKLMDEWQLMEELRVLRAIYLCGSGDFLHQFLMSIFGKHEKGEPCDDDFELNTILQDSIRNSADASILYAPDSLTVSISSQEETPGTEGFGMSLISLPQKVPSLRIGFHDLDFLKFTYKVPWPLDLIVNAEAITKYSQVMRFLLRVKRAKFVLDKVRMWMWKRKSCITRNQKRQLLVEQKLLHFVDAFHQYVMDRVFHSAWIELCHNMALAGSLDEVIAVHEAYLSSIQRQCFVAPDKLWALISSRIKVILSLAFDFYSVQRTLQTGATAPAIRRRCEMEVDRIEKQFDDCISFLLRILSFRLNVGQFPHLADLVTRINYNHFYMSSSGNLQTTPSFELSSKVMKN